MFDRTRGVLSANAAVKAYDRGDLEKARRKIDEAQRHFAAEPESAMRNRDLGRLHQLTGQVDMRGGRAEEALRSFALAEEFLEKDPSNVRQYGEAMHDIALYLADMGIFPIARLYIEKAANAVGHLPAYADQIRRVTQDLADYGVERTVSPARIETLRQTLLAARGSADRAMHSFNLGAALLEAENEDRDEAFALIKHAVDYYAFRDREMFLQALSVLGDSRQRGRTFPEWFDAASARGLELARETRNPVTIAEAELYRAAYLLSRGDQAGALEHALVSITRNNENSIRTQSSMLRVFNNMGGEAAREVALQVACARNDAGLAAELMESARLQVLPVGAGSAEGYRGTSAAGVLTTFGATKVSPMRPITVDGVSHLAPRYTADVVGDPLEFRDFVRKVGGDGAWWWGAWAFNERIYWCAVGEDDAACGFLDAADDTELGEAFALLLATSLVNDKATTADVLNGPLCSSYREEEALSTTLGHRLIPPILRSELRRRARGDNPLQLVLSGTLFAIVPTTLLGIDPVSSDRYPARLIDAAVLRIAPPAALVDHVDRHPAYPADQLPVSVACVDPRGDLKHSRRVPPGTDVLLAHPKAGLPGSGDFVRLTERATPQALTKALRQLGPSHPSLFYYSGHASGDGDAESGLALQGQIVTADLIFTTVDDGPVVPFPARALLAACSSSGAGGAGAGEWFGLAAAILWAGARQIIATNWRVWDTPFTGRFDLDLAKALRDPGDAAAALRAVQLKWLQRWRAALPDANRSELPLPVIWASYICTGVRW
jgi:tetratricopeptide (TPR) repeat protein